MSKQEELIAMLTPNADTDLMNLFRNGAPSPEAFQHILQRMEKRTVPTHVRAELRLRELHEQAQAKMAEIGKKNHIATLDDWDQLRRSAQKGVRLATHFKVNGINFHSYFLTVRNTAAHQVAWKKVERSS